MCILVYDFGLAVDIRLDLERGGGLLEIPDFSLISFTHLIRLLSLLRSFSSLFSSPLYLFHQPHLY